VAALDTIVSAPIAPLSEVRPVAKLEPVGADPDRGEQLRELGRGRRVVRVPVGGQGYDHDVLTARSSVGATTGPSSRR
jgi:hypothetical protein